MPWLDYGGQVDKLWSQPMAIAFGLEPRAAGSWHVPDFLAQFTDGSYGLFDIRPAELIDKRARLVFDETENVCNVLGWHYRVLGGHDTLATRNLDCLSMSRYDRCRPLPEVEALILRAARDGVSHQDVCWVASPECPPLAFASSPSAVCSASISPSCSGHGTLSKEGHVDGELSRPRPTTRAVELEDYER